MGRPTEPLIDHETVMETALRLVDELGESGLSVRRIAREMDVTAASLYYHFKNKDEILDSLVLYILERTRNLPDTSMRWDDFLVAVISQFRKVAMQYPNAAIIVITRNKRSYSQIVGEMAFRLMKQGGLSEQASVEAMAMLESLAFGSIVAEVAYGPRAEDYGTVDKTTFPTLHEVTRKAHFDYDESFEDLCRMALEGIVNRDKVRKAPRKKAKAAAK